MWGDNPNDYKKVRKDWNGRWVPDLPLSESIGEDWQVDVVWVFTNARQHAVDCIATGIRFVGDGFRECTPSIEEAATRVVKSLWDRYQKNIVKNQHEVAP